MAGTGPTLISSVQRALHLVEEVATANGPVTAKVLATGTNLPLPTTYHLLRTLVYEGYLERVDGGYVLADRFGVLARPSPGQQLTIRARPILRTLHERLGMAAYLGVFDETTGEVIITDVIDSPSASRVDGWVSMHDSAHASAAGKCILASLPESTRREYLEAHPLVELTSQTITNERHLLQQLTLGRPTLVDRGEYLPGNSCLAAPVVADGIVGAVCVSFPSHRFDDAVAAEADVQHAGRRVGLSLSL